MYISRCLCGWNGGEEDYCPRCGIDLNLLTEFWKQFTAAKRIDPVSDVAPSSDLACEIRDAWEVFIASRRMQFGGVAGTFCQHCLEWRLCMTIRIPTAVVSNQTDPLSFTIPFQLLTLCGNCTSAAQREGHPDLILCELRDMF